jgi:glycosyltransferase involved in cell wall biosynthesis
LLANGELRDNLGLAARRAAQDFGWERVGDGVEQLYRSLLQPRETARPA